MPVWRVGDLVRRWFIGLGGVGDGDCWWMADSAEEGGEEDGSGLADNECGREGLVGKNISEELRW